MELPPGKGANDTKYWYMICIKQFGPLGATLEIPEQEGWGGPNPPAPPPTAADVMPPLWAHVKSLLVRPAIQVQPNQLFRPEVHIPTFVAITNPQPATRYETWFAGIHVWIDVDPAVTLNSGEPKATAASCDDDGTTFVPGAGSARHQAEAPGACAHIYEHRTGTGGRPAAWGGNVTITWTVTWDSNQAGQNGALAAAPSVTPFQRFVDESQGIVTKAGG
jgi:hypothetical protein